MGFSRGSSLLKIGCLGRSGDYLLLLAALLLSILMGVLARIVADRSHVLEVQSGLESGGSLEGQSQLVEVSLVERE